MLDNSDKKNQKEEKEKEKYTTPNINISSFTLYIYRKETPNTWKEQLYSLAESVELIIGNETGVLDESDRRIATKTAGIITITLIIIIIRTIIHIGLKIIAVIIINTAWKIKPGLVWTETG